MLPALRRIHSTAHALAQKYSAHAPPRPSSNVSPSTVPTLPLPEPLTPRLLDLGIDESSAKLISAAMTRAVSRIRESFLVDYQRRLQLLRPQLHYFIESRQSMIPAAYVNVYNKAIQDWTSYILDTFAPRVIRARALHLQQNSRIASKRPFNQNAIPVLEKAFEANPFPSRLEKFELAVKSHMEYRQIHVWFQNRRSRCRKEGKEFRRRKPSEVLLEALEDSVVDALLPIKPEDESEDGGSCPSLSEAPQSSIGLPPHAPLHAFPSPYPPLCSNNPFPLTAEQRKLQIPWIRTSGACRPPRRPADISELTTALAKLSLDVEDAAHATPSEAALHRAMSSHKPLWYHYGFVTHCCQAPHPALIRRERPFYSTRVPGIRADHRSNSCHRSPRGVPRSPPPRVKRTLPRRLPKHPPLHCNSAMESRPARSKPSRQASETSLSSRSSAPNTPLLTPTSLPVPLPSTYTMDEISSCLSLPELSSFSLSPDWNSLSEDCTQVHVRVVASA